MLLLVIPTRLAAPNAGLITKKRGGSAAGPFKCRSFLATMSIAPPDQLARAGREQPQGRTYGGPVAEAQLRPAATSAHAQYDAATLHRFKRYTSTPGVRSFACGVIGLTVQLPVMLFVLSRHPIPGNVWSESVLLSVLPFLGIAFGAIGLDQIRTTGQRGRAFAGIGLLIGVLEFVPILVFLLGQD